MHALSDFRASLSVVSNGASLVAKTPHLRFELRPEDWIGKSDRNTDVARS